MAIATPRLPERYQQVGLLAHGGMGTVYRAYDTTLGRAVAIKLMDERYARDPAVRQRFEREARAAARLSGEPGSVTIYDVGECDGRPHIVMEYLPGGSLEARLRDGKPPLGQALRWLDQAASALDAAHRAGIVHRDVKPANFLLDADANVHVADFGIASAVGLDSMTSAGTIMGTAGYLSPEQANGQRAAAASDRYAFAVVAFELLTGRRPFERQSPTAEAAAHVHEPVPSACSRSGDLPCELDPVFERALAKEPAVRFATCAAFVGALHDALAAAEGGTQIVPPPERHLPAPPVEAPRRPRRRRSGSLVPLLLGVIALAVAGLAAALLLRNHKTAAPPPPKAVVKTLVVTTQAKASKPPRAQTVTVTEAAPPPVTRAAQTTPVASTPVQSGDGRSLNDQGYARMRAGDYNGALPLLQQAVQKLQGSGPPYEGYANFNLGYTLLQLGRCSEALAHLQRADVLEPGNQYVQSALRRARSC